MSFCPVTSVPLVLAAAKSQPWGHPSVDTCLGFTRCVVHPSEEASPCRPPRATLRFDPVRNTGRTVSSRSSNPPFTPSASVGGRCARSLAVGGNTHESNGGGSTPPKAAVGELWRSAYGLFITSPLIPKSVSSTDWIFALLSNFTKVFRGHDA